MRNARFLFLLLAPCSLLSGGDAPAAAPALDWVLPIFTDHEGYRSMTLKGAEARPVGENLAVKDLHITLFSGDASARVDAVLVSETAVFYPKSQRAGGEGLVRLVRDDADVSGHGWHYDHLGKKISIQRKVRVVFAQTHLDEILK